MVKVPKYHGIMCQFLSFNPYLATIFVLKMFAFSFCCIYFNALQTRLFHGGKHCEPDQTASPRLRLRAVLFGSILFVRESTQGTKIPLVITSKIAKG